MGAKICLEELARGLRSILCEMDGGEQRQGTERRMRKACDREYSVSAFAVERRHHVRADHQHFSSFHLISIPSGRSSHGHCTQKTRKISQSKRYPCLCSCKWSTHLPLFIMKTGLRYFYRPHDQLLPTISSWLSSSFLSARLHRPPGFMLSTLCVPVPSGPSPQHSMLCS